MDLFAAGGGNEHFVFEYTKNLSELVDIRDVVIDKSLPLEERVRSYVEQIKDPYYFKVGDVVVRVSYADKDKSLTDSFTSMIASM